MQKTPDCVEHVGMEEVKRVVCKAHDCNGYEFSGPTAPIPSKLKAMVGPRWLWSAWRRPDQGDTTMAHALTPPLRRYRTRVPSFQYLLLSLVTFMVFQPYMLHGRMGYLLFIASEGALL